MRVTDDLIKSFIKLTLSLTVTTLSLPFNQLLNIHMLV